MTRPEDIAAAFAQTIERFGRCDVVFNNAGFGILGEIESTVPDDQARAMFEVNFWGAANVSREAVRVFREANLPNSGGRLLNMSSGAGFTGNAALGYYSARYDWSEWHLFECSWDHLTFSLHKVNMVRLLALLISIPDSSDTWTYQKALEGFTDSLSKEVDPAWNIKVFPKWLMFND